MSTPALSDQAVAALLREPVEAPPTRRAGRRRRALGVVLPATLAGWWTLVSWQGWVGPTLLPAPWTVTAAGRNFFFGDAVETIPGVIPFVGAGWEHLAASLWRCLVAWVLAVGVGVAVGLALALSRLVSDLLDPLVNGLRAVPLYAWLPLALVWFGLGEGAARAIIFVGALWPVLIATADGVGRVPRGHVETARMLGTPRRWLWRRVYLPSALPEIVTGLRLSLTLAWMCVIVGELNGTTSGVGAMMNAARQTARTDQIIVGIVVFAVIGFLADLILRTVAGPWVRWSRT